MKVKQSLENNYCALLATIFNPKLTADKALSMFGITYHKEYNRIRNKPLNKTKPKKPMPPKEELKYLYVNKKMTQQEIAKIYNVSNTTVVNWFKKLNIKARNASEAKIYKKERK